VTTLGGDAAGKNGGCFDVGLNLSRDLIELFRRVAKVNEMRSHQDDRQRLADLVSQIKSEHAVRDKPSARWPSLLGSLESFIASHPQFANDDRLVSAVVEFAAEFSDASSLALLASIQQSGIGSTHSLLFCACALSHEHQSNFVGSLDAFKRGLSVGAAPEVFLTQQLAAFKKRMVRRLSGQSRVPLGSLDGSLYSFVDGGLSCTLANSHLPDVPKFDFLAEIDFATKTDSRLQPGYDPALLLGDDGRDRSFEEARLHAAGLDYVSRRCDDAPRSILKRPSPTNRKESRTAVRFTVDSPKKQLPPPAKRSLVRGESVLLGEEQAIVERPLGRSSHLCSSASGFLVVKPTPSDCPEFAPENEELFCLPVWRSSDFYVTKFRPFGTFTDFADAFAERRSGREPVAWFVLLQLLRIVRNLERHFFVHGAIGADTLLNQFAADELPTHFDMKGAWRDEGFCLCRCDGIRRAAGAGGDREAVAGLFCRLVTGGDLTSGVPEKPPNWKNGELWQFAFEVLGSARPLDDVIGRLIEEVTAAVMPLRSWKARINSRIYDKFAEAQ
jgi:hypothetical protein